MGKKDGSVVTTESATKRAFKKETAGRHHDSARHMSALHSRAVGTRSAMGATARF